jgi:phage RecT family recombinase
MNNKLPAPSNTQITEHLNKQGGRQNKITIFEDQVRTWFRANMKRLHQLAGSADDANRLLLSALNSLQKIPSLAECTPESWASCLMQAAEYRLFPGAMAQCAFVPFNNSKKQCKEATFILQYQGLCELLYRSGMIKDIEADVVCSKDIFEFRRGSNRSLTFEPFDGDYSERGEWIGVYCIIRNVFGGEHITYMSAKEVDGIRARSRGASGPDSPWNSKFDSDVAWMWKKTALKQCAKLAPKSATAAVINGAIAIDEQPQEQPASNIMAAFPNDFDDPKPQMLPQTKAALPQPVSSGSYIDVGSRDAEAIGPAWDEGIPEGGPIPGVTGKYSDSIKGSK